MKCIICGKEVKESTEHIIPEALGNEGLVTKRVCEFCNNRLGTNVDNYLTDHPLVKIIRINNNLIGKKGKKIKFFDGIEEDIHSGTKYNMKGEIPKIVPRIISDEEGKIRVEAANFDEGMDYLKKVLKRKGYSEKDIKAYCEDVHRLESNHQVPEFHKDASINLLLMDLAAIKIAYEYAHHVLGDEYLDDKVALLFKSELYGAVMSEKHEVKPDDELAKYVTFPITGSGIEKELEEQREGFGLTDMNVRHTIFFKKRDNCLYCILNLCMTDVISFAVKITENADQYKKDLPISLVFEDGSAITMG